MLKPVLLEGFSSSLPMFGEDLHSPSPFMWPEVVAVHTSIVWALEEEEEVSQPMKGLKFL